jgi:hypothetical protein
LNGGTRGRRPTEFSPSPFDGTTVYQFQPYGIATLVWVIMLPSATLTLTTPRHINHRLWPVPQGLHSFITNGTQSQTFNFNAQDWFSTPIMGIQGIGLIRGEFCAEDNGELTPTCIKPRSILARSD